MIMDNPFRMVSIVINFAYALTLLSNERITGIMSALESASILYNAGAMKGVFRINKRGFRIWIEVV
jgi:hypothetical protein